MIVVDVSQCLLSFALLVKETHVWLSVETKYILFSPSLSFKGNFTEMDSVMCCFLEDGPIIVI